MRRRKQPENRVAITPGIDLLKAKVNLGLVLSGGGTRASYQVGALRALAPFLDQPDQPISTIVGSSIGAVNGLMLAACLNKGLHYAIDRMHDMWIERTFKNTFAGSPSRAFFRAIKIAALQYMAPGPHASNAAIFDPSPLIKYLDQVIDEHGGLRPEDREPHLRTLGVMTTIEGAERKPLLFLSTHRRIEDAALQGASFDICYVDALTAKHGFASAALPSILPPVELDTAVGRVRLVDGGISQNVPVDPAVRVGAEQVIVIDISGRNWWLDRFGEPHDSRPSWEVPAAFKTFCMRPPETFVIRCQTALGPLLRQIVGKRRARFISAVGPVWPLFTLLNRKLGEEVAYEVMSYVALDPEFTQALMETGYNETMRLLKNKHQLEFERAPTFQEWAQAL